MQDATLALLHYSCCHLGGSGTRVGLLFVDFSSVFSTIQAHLLVQKCTDQLSSILDFEE